MSCTILLVDDHVVFREGLKALLDKQEGVRVLAESGDGREAASLAKELGPDIVLMDVSLPGMSGLLAAQQIKAECPDVKIIGLSMHSERRYVVGMLEAGAAGYVVKSGDFAEVRRAIEEVCHGGTYFSPKVAGVAEGTLRDGATGPASPLSKREREVLQLLAEGGRTKDIAARLNVSSKTVEGYRAQIMTKLNLRTVAELTKYAVREGLTSLDP